MFDVIGDVLRSMSSEIVALVVFFVSWTVVNQFLRRKDAPQKKLKEQPAPKKKSNNPQEMAEVVMGLCQDQFTRALRLYRDMVKHGNDRHILDEGFYTALVEAAIRVGKSDVAEQIIQRMHENGMIPSIGFLQSLLKLFAARKCFRECIRAWDLFEPSPDQVIYSCLTLAAGEIGDVELCRNFLRLSKKNFNMTSRDYIPLFRAHSRKKDYISAVADLREVMKSGVMMENIACNTVLSVCVHSPDLSLIETMIKELREYEVEHDVKLIDIVSYNTLMKAAAKRKDVQKCFRVLNEISEAKLDPDDVSFSTLLDVCIDEEEHHLASLALEQMCESGVTMNCVLLTTLMKGFIRSKHLDKAMQLFDNMRGESSQVKPDMITYSMLIKAQCDAGDMGKALQILEDMLQCKCDIDDVVFTHLIEGCCNVSNVALAEKLFKDMQQANIRPSVYTLTAMVKVYGKCAQSEKAWELVQCMHERFALKPTVVIYTCLISGLMRQKKYADAYAAFQWMKNMCTPDGQSVSTMILGLADSKMWPELSELCKETVDRRPMRVSQESYNYALSKLADHDMTMARDLYKTLKSHIDLYPQVVKRFEEGWAQEGWAHQ
jgi:pentatricopeptide repeat protein